MPRVKKSDQRPLLIQLSDLGYGQSEVETKELFLKRFHPVVKHMGAFDPTVVLIVGERGTGKSALFKVVFERKLLGALTRHAPNRRFPPVESGQTSWIQAYPREKYFAPPDGVRRCLDERADVRQAHDLWFAYLVRALKEQLADEFQESLKEESLRELLDLPAADPRRILQAFAGAEEAPVLALDRLDEELERQDKWIFVGYDELDTVAGFDWEAMIQAVRGLMALWAGYSRRWRRLRAKIFLRTDLFRRHAGVGGADLAKLAANRVELSWSDQSLFTMLVKRIANTDDALLDYSCGARGVRFKAEDPDLGWIPDFAQAADARPLIERLVGPYMGANQSKGLTFRWVLDHLRDGRGHASPRALVRLLEGAARKELDDPRATVPRLLHPTSLRRALEDVSEDHVTQAIDEWPWLEGVKQRVEKHLVPLERREIEKLLAQDWDGTWSVSKPETRPPQDRPSEFVDYLLELGVFRRHPDGRVNVPDVYLFGLRLRRRGGVSRGRSRTKRS